MRFVGGRDGAVGIVVVRGGVVVVLGVVGATVVRGGVVVLVVGGGVDGRVVVVCAGATGCGLVTRAGSQAGPSLSVSRP